MNAMGPPGAGRQALSVIGRASAAMLAMLLLAGCASEFERGRQRALQELGRVTARRAELDRDVHPFIAAFRQGLSPGLDSPPYRLDARGTACGPSQELVLRAVSVAVRELAPASLPHLPDVAAGLRAIPAAPRGEFFAAAPGALEAARTAYASAAAGPQVPVGYHPRPLCAGIDQRTCRQNLQAWDARFGRYHQEVTGHAARYRGVRRVERALEALRSAVAHAQNDQLPSAGLALGQAVAVLGSPHEGLALLRSLIAGARQGCGGGGG